MGIVDGDQAHLKFGLMRETKCLIINLPDRDLSLEGLSRKNTKNLLAAKYEKIAPEVTF